MIHNGMSAADLTGWRKATGSDAHNDYCVMLTAVDGQVGMCNSHDRAGPGHDFLLTRDRHGAGFWDRGLGDKGDRLTAAAHVYGKSGLYVGDSGDIHTTNESTRCTDCGCETLA